MIILQIANNMMNNYDLIVFPYLKLKIDDMLYIIYQLTTDSPINYNNSRKIIHNPC